MFSRTFNYTDYNGQPRKETWYFNLTKAEVLKMELGSWGGMSTMLRRLIREENPEKIIDIIEKMILGAVGEKSPDGRKFIKSKEIQEDFRLTPAYDELFQELVLDPDKAILFVKGCLPEDLAAAISENEKLEAEQNGKVVAIGGEGKTE